MPRSGLVSGDDDLDLAYHPGFVVARQDAGKVKLSRLVESPDDFTLFAGRHMRHVGYLRVRMH